MRNEFEITYLPRALADLDEIVDYMLYELKASTAALRFVDVLNEKVNVL